MREKFQSKTCNSWIWLFYKSYVLGRIQFLFVAFIIFIISPLYAQSEVGDNSYLVFQDEKLSTILFELSNKENLNFSYDAKDPVFETKINFSSKGKSTQQILDDILINTGVTYKLIGNQYVLYRELESMDQSAINETVTTEANSPEGLVLDATTTALITEYRIDTLKIMDTIFRVDTIWLTDTVFIKEEKQKKPTTSKIKEIPVDFFQEGSERNTGWALGIFAAPILSDFSLVDGQKSFSLSNYSLGIDAVKLLKKWNINFGLRLTQFNHRFSQQYVEQEGGFYQNDTVDTYYTVFNTDTSWYYVTDSAWVPLQTEEYNYDRTNTLGYFELSVSASFDFYQSPKSRFYVKAGGQLSFLIYKNGIAIPNKNQAEGIDFDELQFNEINYSFLLGVGLKQKISSKVDFNIELYYSGYLNSLVPDFPFDTQINALGLKVGLVFYL